MFVEADGIKDFVRVYMLKYVAISLILGYISIYIYICITSIHLIYVYIYIHIIIYIYITYIND